MKTLETKKLQDFQINGLEKIKSLSQQEDLLVNDYIIGVVNLSSNCLNIAGTRPPGTDDKHWKWMVIPKTCRNCTTSYQDCADHGRYSPIMSTPCDSPPFELFIGYMIDDNNARGAVFRIEPDCDHAGGLVGVD